MDILTIGSVIRLKNVDVKLMILNRALLYNKDGIICYYDYSAYIYVNGKVEEQVYLFNRENIEEIYFEGYKDEQEELFREKYKEKMKDINYPKLSIDD